MCLQKQQRAGHSKDYLACHLRSAVCLKIEIHEIHKIYEIHCLKIEIHKGHEIHSKATLAKYRNPRNPHWQGSQQTNRQLL